MIGSIMLDGVLSEREKINQALRVRLDEVTERWGVKVTNVEIREINPPREIQDAMNRQMSAERNRRAVVTESAGQREAAINVADGESVTFRSGGQLFTWTFNGFDRRAVDVAKIAPAGFPTRPLVVQVGLNPANRR